MSDQTTGTKSFTPDQFDQAMQAAAFFAGIKILRILHDENVRSKKILLQTLKSGYLAGDPCFGEALKRNGFKTGNFKKFCIFHGVDLDTTGQSTEPDLLD